jgi:hypothetical protein
MSEKEDFATLLDHHMNRKDFTPDRLSSRSDVPKATIISWRTGTVNRPRDWQPIAKVAEALELNNDEVDKLFEAAGHPTVSMLLQMDLVKEDRRLLSRWNSPTPPPPPPQKRWIVRLLALGSGLIVLLVIIWIFISPLFSKPPIWQEDFNQKKRGWAETSAIWQDIQGVGAILVENDPGEKYGKVESEVITVDIDAYPILKVVVSEVDLNASYSVQLLDKSNDASQTIISEVGYPDEYTINLAEEMGWRGRHSFTINLWISGENKSAKFDLVSIEAE